MKDIVLLQEEKVLIFKFLCVLAWADFLIHPAERKFIEDLSKRLQVGSELEHKIQGWLQHPPRPEDVDPYSIPNEMIELVLEQASMLAVSDGTLDHRELEIIEALHSLCD